MKKIKPLIITLIILATVCFVLSGCSKTNTSSSSVSSSSANNAQNSKIKGSWFVSSCKIDGKETDTSKLFNNFYMIKEDGTFDISSNGNIINSGTYTFDGTTLVLSYANNKTVMTLQNGNQLLYKANTDEGETETLYERS